MESRETDVSRIIDFPIHHFPDRSARWLLEDKENVRGLIEILADRIAAEIDFTRLTQLNRSFVSETLREQESDLIFSVPFHGGPEDEELMIYILIEHQSTVDVAMGFRMLFYMTQLWDSQRREWESADIPKGQWRLRPILPIVLYTGSQRWNTTLSLTNIMQIPDALARFVPTFDLLFLSVKDVAASDLTRTDHPLGWLLTVLQQEHAQTAAISDALQEAMRHLSELGGERSEALRRAVVYLLLLILHRRPVEEHTALISILNEHAKEMEVNTMAETITGTLLERGIQQGIEQGIEKGAKESTIESILLVLDTRFEANTTQTLRPSLEAIDDVQRLKSLLRKAAQTQSLQTFISNLTTNGDVD